MMSFYVVRGYDVNGKQVGETVKCDTPQGSADIANAYLYQGCKSIDIDVIDGDVVEADDEQA